MSDYTPSTADIKWAYQEQCNHYYADCEIKPKEHANEFDRWLAEHDAEVVARTLAAQYTGGVCQVFDADLEWRDWVKDAEGLIKGENE